MANPVVRMLLLHNDISVKEATAENVCLIFVSTSGRTVL